MKTYTFLSEDGTVIEVVRAEDHDQAVEKANGWQGDKELVTSNTDFYSEEIEQDE